MFSFPCECKNSRAEKQTTAGTVAQVHDLTLVSAHFTLYFSSWDQSSDRVDADDVNCTAAHCLIHHFQGHLTAVGLTQHQLLCIQTSTLQYTQYST